MFRKCKSIDEVKKLHRKLAMCLHPDHGGTNELMALLTESYEDEIERFENGRRRDSGEFDFDEIFEQFVKESRKTASANKEHEKQERERKQREKEEQKKKDEAERHKPEFKEPDGNIRYEQASVNEHKIKDFRLNILLEIKEYAKKNESFDPAFVDSVIKFWAQNFYITRGQYNALVNIYHCFKMFESD